MARLTQGGHQRGALAQRQMLAELGNGMSRRAYVGLNMIGLGIAGDELDGLLDQLPVALDRPAQSGNFIIARDAGQRLGLRIELLRQPYGLCARLVQFVGAAIEEVIFLVAAHFLHGFLKRRYRHAFAHAGFQKSQIGGCKQHEAADAKRERQITQSDLAANAGHLYFNSETRFRF